MRNFVLVAAIVLCGGCSTVPAYKNYPGPERPVSALAHIGGLVEADHKILQGLNEVVLVTCVDGKSTDNFFSLNKHRYPSEALVEPGRHYVGVMYGWMNTYATAALWLDAEAGHTYRINRAVNGYTAKLWLTDERTGLSVGGIVGGESPPAPVTSNCSAQLHRG